jgi:hypothetical protein
LEPGDANILAEMCRYSNVWGLRHHWQYITECTRTDPLSALTPLVVSSYRWLHGPIEEAAGPGRRSMEMAPGPSPLHVIAGWQIAEAGNEAEAADILERASAGMGRSAIGVMAGFLACALRGDRSGAVRVSAADWTDLIGNEFICRFLGAACARLGRKDEAVSWVRRAVDFGMIHHPFLAGPNPFMDEVRREPAYQRLMDEIEPRWEAVVAWEGSLPRV